MDKLNIAVIILTYNEEIHIRRCIENVSPIVKEIFIIDSFSTDNTVEIARSYNHVQVLQNKWENQYAKQFNWGLENAPITAEWVLRLDADEYLMPELITELCEKLPTLGHDITGISFKRRYIFMNKWLKHGLYPAKLLRLFRYGKGFCEQRLMDEHIQLIEGRAIEFVHDIVDENLNNLSWMCHKYVNYAIREAVDQLDIKLDLTGAGATDKKKHIGQSAYRRRMIKHIYVRLPLFLRSFAFFCYRYFFRCAFVYGKRGFIYHFMNSLWYRMLVDAKIFEIRYNCGIDKAEIRKYLQTHYNLDI